MSRVYVPQHNQNSKTDISDLARFGDTKIIFTRYLYPDEADSEAPRIIAIANRELADFDPASDYLALVGSFVYVAICSMILGSRWGTVNVLQFDNHENAYCPIPFNTGGRYDFGPGADF